MPSENLSTNPPEFHAFAVQCAVDGVDAASLGEESIDELRSLLRALVSLSGHDSVIGGLAQVAFDLADSRHNTLDCIRHDTEKNLRILRSLSIQEVDSLRFLAQIAGEKSEPVQVEKITLSQSEVRLISAYRKMQERPQDLLVKLSESYSDLFPRHTPVNLRLVAGGAE